VPPPKCTRNKDDPDLGRAGDGRGPVKTPAYFFPENLAGFVLFGLAVSGLFALAEREKRLLALIFMLGERYRVDPTGRPVTRSRPT
jgi:hypothetical protein